MESFQEENLQDELKKQGVLIEKQKQDIHELQMCLRAKTALEEDTKFELQALQEELQRQKNVHGEELSKMKAMFSREMKEKVDELNLQLEEKVNQTAQLERKVEELSQCKPESNSNLVEVMGLQTELTEAKREMGEMAQAMETLDRKREEASRQFAQAAEELEELQQQYSHSKQSCGALREENINLKEELEHVQEELQGLKMELMSLRHEAKASKESAEEIAKRGNSLFAEVEDNRQAAMTRLKEAAEETARAKREMMMAKKEVQMLRVQNATLHNQWETCNKTTNLEYMDSDLKRRHDEYIKNLETKISKLEAELVKKASFLPESISDMSWVQDLRIRHQKEVNSMEGELRQAEFKLFISEEGKLRHASKERSLTAQNMQLEGQVRALKLQLESIDTNKESAASSSEQVAPKVPNPISVADAFLATLASRQQAKRVQFASSIFANTQNQENVRPKKIPVSATPIRMPPANDHAK